jgi:hypothetical protein
MAAWRSTTDRSLVVVGHRSGPALLHGQTRLGAVERLDLALLVDGQDDGVLRRVDIKTDHIAQFFDKLGIGGELELPDPMGCSPCARQIRCTELTLMPQACAIMAAVQCVVSAGGSVSVNATTRSATSGPSGATRKGRVLSRNRPSTPSSMKRSCQRQTQVLDLPVRRMIAAVPNLSAVSRTISARHTCFWAALRSLTNACRRRRSDGFNVMEIPVRMHKTRTQQPNRESPNGFKRQTLSTRSLPS